MPNAITYHEVLQLLKSWEYKNLSSSIWHPAKFYSYLNLESTKTRDKSPLLIKMFYSYLNLESTKTKGGLNFYNDKFYSYLNLESTKTGDS